jgi:hypothetical protein
MGYASRSPNALRCPVADTDRRAGRQTGKPSARQTATHDVSNDWDRGIDKHRPDADPTKSDEELLRRELEQEQSYVDHCYRLLEQLRLRAESNLRDSIDLEVSTPQSVFEREVFASYSRKRLQAVAGSEHQLVFGRLDVEDGVKPVYVGRIGLADDDQERVLVDWRAPVGSSFYRATARAPLGVIRRRTLITQGRKVVDINDDVLISAKAGQLGVVTGEGALMTALLRERGEYMQDIVATIQAEQDEVIRADPRSSIVLTGGPGTGKSVVALHRTAYLMYERAAELERRGVLVVGPGRRFSRYISRVLPSLGETSVNIRSVFDLTSPLVARDREPLPVGRIKGSAPMARVLKSYLIDTYPMPQSGARLAAGGRIVRIEPEELASLRRRILSSKTSGFNAAESQLWLALANRVLRLSEQRTVRKRDAAALASSLNDRSDLQDLIGAMLPPRDALEAWREVGSHAETFRRHLSSHLPHSQADELVEDLARAGEPRVGDLALIDELGWLLGPAADDEPAGTGEPGYEELMTAQDRLDESRPRSISSSKDQGYGHIVIDEAQDVTAMQWRMIRRRGEEATWTIVGDPAQTTLAAPNALDRAVEELFGGAGIRRFTLAINYRTPREIMEYASRASGVSLSSVRSIRSGPPPLTFRFTGSPEAALHRAATWLRSLGGSGCFVAVDAGDVRTVQGRIDGLEAIWAVDAKGLEFDNVVLVRPEAVDRDADSSLILIGATRATKRLAVVTSRPSLH